MKYVDLQDALDIHDDIISEMQGLSGYNQTNLGYLDSALENIQNDDFSKLCSKYKTFYLFLLGGISGLK